jgi:hypothetical protein
LNRGNIKGGGLATKGEIRFSEQQSQRGREINIKGVEQGRQSKILNDKDSVLKN